MRKAFICGLSHLRLTIIFMLRISQLAFLHALIKFMLITNFIKAGEEGLEPPSTVLETVALPLNYSPRSCPKSSNLGIVTYE